MTFYKFKFPSIHWSFLTEVFPRFISLSLLFFSISNWRERMGYDHTVWYFLINHNFQKKEQKSEAQRTTNKPNKDKIGTFTHNQGQKIIKRQKNSKNLQTKNFTKKQWERA